MRQKKEISKGAFIPLFFIALAIAVTLCGIGIGTASATTTVEISPSTQAVGLGDTFTVNIDVTPDQPIQAVQADLSFNSSLVTVNSVTTGGMFADIFMAGTTDNIAGTVTGIVGSLTGGATTSTPGTFAVISLTASSTNSGTTTLGLFNVIVVGAESSVTNGTVDVGVIAPSVTVVYPNGGETLSGTVTVTATASDEDGTVTNVEFLYSADGGSTWTSLGSDTTAPYEYEWDTTTVSDGANYLIKAIATDNDGATSVDISDSTFTIDNPVVGTAVSISPSTQAVGLGETFTVNIDVTPDQPIQAVQADLSFNSSLVTVNSVTTGGMFADIFMAGTTDNVAGTVTGMVGSLTGGATTSTPGTFAVISLTASSTNSGATTLGLFNVIAVGAVSTTITNGTVNVGVEVPPSCTVSITNTTITLPQTTDIHVVFSERVTYQMNIEDSAGTPVYWYPNTPGERATPVTITWDGTYKVDGTDVPEGIYTVNVTLESTTTGLSAFNNTQAITVEGPPVPHVVINEFIAARWTYPATDLIELYNPTDADVDLTGWTLVAHDPETTTAIALLDGETITAGGYLVYECVAEGPFTISQSGDILILKNGSAEVDRVAWGDYDDGNIADNAQEPGLENSTGRDPNGVDTDVDIDDFRVFTTPTIGEDNTPPEEDITPPSIRFIDPTPATGERVTVDYVTVSVNVTDPSGVSTVLLNWNGINETMDGTGENIWSVTKTNLQDRDYTFKVYANDTVGNMGVSDTRVVTVDVGPVVLPEVSIYTDTTFYMQGNTMHVGLDVTNLDIADQDVRFALWLELPTGGIYVVYPPTPVTLPAGLDYSNPDFMVITLSGLADGTYIWNAALIAPTGPIEPPFICDDTWDWYFYSPVGTETPTEDITTVLEQAKTTVVIDFGK